MSFRKMLQHIKISRYKPSTSIFIPVVKNYYNASNFLPTKTVDKLSNLKYINKDINQSNNSKNMYEELTMDLSMVCMMTTKDEWYYDLLCPNLTVSLQEVSLISDLQNTFSIENLFEVLENHINPLNYNEACQAIYSLSNIKHLRQFKFKNSLIHVKHSKDFFSLVYSHPKFSDILDIIKEESSVERLCTLMMCLDNIGLDLSNDLMIDLHLKILKSISDLDIPSLVRLSYVFIGKSILSYYTQVNIFNEMHKKVYFDKISMTNLVFLSILYRNMPRIMSMEESYQYLYYVKTFADKNGFNDTDITSLLLILSTCSKLFKNNTPVNICRSITKLFVDRIDELNPQQLSVLNNIYQNVHEPRSLLPKLQEAAFIFINKSENVALQTDLLLCLSLNSRFNKKKEYESLAAKILDIPYECQDFASLFKALRFLRPSNYKLCHTFWSNSMENIKSRLSECEEVIGVRESILRLFYGKYMNFDNNFRGKMRILEVEQEMVSLLQSEIHSSTKHIPTKVAHMIGFLIAYSRADKLSDQWYDLLEEKKPQLKYYDIAFLSRGLEFQLQTYVHNKKEAELLSKFKSLLDSCTEDCLKDTQSLQEIISLTNAFLVREGSPSSNLFQELSDQHSKHLDEISSKNIPQVLQNFKNSNFTNPEVFEAVSDYIISNRDDVSSTAVHRVLSTFFNLGYTPKKEEFVDACQTVVKDDYKIMSCRDLLKCCLAFAFLRGISSELIHYVFCIKFLDQIEEEIEHSSINYSSSVRNLLMRLNRSVCLDYPEEKVPWFHKQYCQDMVEMKPRNVSGFLKEVAGVLSSILGGEENIAFNKKSPYYDNIDLEFAVGKDGVPLSWVRDLRRLENNNKMSSSDSSDIRRFAVLARSKNCYTKNDYTLSGNCQMQRRHLEMHGYFVVEVLERDFYSMAVATESDKQKLLKNLIMKAVVKESH